MPLDKAISVWSQEIRWRGQRQGTPAGPDGLRQTQGTEEDPKIVAPVMALTAKKGYWRQIP